jgi:hypothetical protein
MSITAEGAQSKMDHGHTGKKSKLGVVSGVYIPVCLNIISILMFLRFGRILGRIGLLGMLGECSSQWYRACFCSNASSRSPDRGLHRRFCHNSFVVSHCFQW